jgi:hypothetical protein
MDFYNEIIANNIYNLYDKFGKITIKKETKIYHWSDKEFDIINNNSFFSLCNDDWKQNKKYCYEYEIIEDVSFLLTIVNKKIEKGELCSNKTIYDSQILTNLFNFFVRKNCYSSNGDVDLKISHEHFKYLCENLLKCNYHGLFNYIDNKTRFELVIFEPNKYLNFIFM